MSDPVLVEPNGDQGTVRAGDDLKVSVYKRLEADGRWPEVEPIRNAMMKEARGKGLSKEDAQAWTYAELDRLYPPMQPVVIVASEEGNNSEFGVAADGDTRTRARGIPPGWPALPANASLAAEIAWVQANRLDVVDGDRIRLERAHEPAPSRAALGWLETSIRSYAKYVEVAAKATATAADEQGMVRRERMAIEEIRELLGEMLE